MVVKKIDGVGKDAKTVTNKQGGMQSEVPLAMHLLDAQFLVSILEKQNCKNGYRKREELALIHIAEYMATGNDNNLLFAVGKIEPDYYIAMMKISQVLKEGAEKYEVNNWRLIPQEEHINHAMIHLLASLMGDTQDEHLNHALCRLMMAYSTFRTEGFSYLYHHSQLTKNIGGNEAC